jgi:soluble lytic murein transglycosylase
MARHKILLGLCLSIIMLAGCQLDAERYPIVIGLQPATPTFTPSPTRTATSTPTPTPSPTPTNTPTPTITPTPTATPFPSERLGLAQRAYQNGDYETARLHYHALLAEPGLDPHEQRLALHWRGRSELKLGDTAAAIATLKMFLGEYPSDELTRAAQFNLGVAYEQAGQYDEAIKAYRGSIIPNDPINVYIYERIGDAGLKTTAYTDTVTAYQAGIASTDDEGFQVHLREGIAQAELKRDDPAAAIVQYEAILDVAKIEAYRAKILRLAGEAHLAAGEPERAHERFLEAVDRYPEAYDSYLALVELVDDEVPVDDFQRGLVDYYAQAYQPAIDAFERYLNSAGVVTTTDTALVPVPPTTNLTSTATISQVVPPPVVAGPTPLPKAADAIWTMARSQQAAGQYHNAINTFQRLIDEYPNHPDAVEAHLQIGQTLVSQDRIGEAKAAFRDFAERFPNHRLAAEALWRAARLELEGDLLSAAHASLRDLATRYPASEYTIDALYWAGQSAFKLGHYEDAIAAWTDLTSTYPTSELASFGSYWRAKSLLELDRADEANTVLTQLVQNSDDYYVLRARDLLTNSQPEPVPLILPAETELALEQAEAEAWLGQWLGLAGAENLAALSSQVRGDPAFQRGAGLLDLDLRDEALVEFETVQDNWRDNALAMYQLAIYFRDQGLSRLSIVAAARLNFLSPARSVEDAPMFIQRLYYPVYFEDVIFAEAATYNLDPALVLAIMRQESLFERSAHSVAGARGLMQVMPGTGEYVATRADFGAYEADQLWLPYLNIRYGTWYINQQLGLFDNNQFAALAAYNAGPGNVLDWVKTSDDLDIFVESIPFRESRVYIRRIYTNLSAYRRIYGAPRPVSSSD